MSVNSARPLYPPIATRLDALEPEEFGIPHHLRNQPGIAGLHPAWAQSFQSWYQVLSARGFPCEIEQAAGVIGIKDGTCILLGTGALAMTIVPAVQGPMSGTPPQTNGDDMKVLMILSTTAFAHTVTGPANTFSGSRHLLTFSGTAGSYIRMIAYNGIWYTLDFNGVTIS